jgi:hypothetical protein
MEDTPESLPSADAEDPADVGYSAGHRVLAGAMLVGTLLLSYVCLDVITNGMLTRIISVGPDYSGVSP